MKKFLFMLVICVSSFMIYTNNVKADTCDNFYNANWNASTHSSNAGVGFNEFTHNITAMGFNQNYDYIKLPVFVALTSSNTTSNINLSAMCSSSNLQFSDYTITYADGSTATIDSNSANTICTNVNYSGSNQYFYTPTIENVFIKLKYLDSYGGQQSVYCNFENGIAVCPNPGANTQINGLIVQVGLNYNSSLISYGLVTGFVQWCHDDNQKIINKLNDINNKLTQQNTTAQQISNNTNEIKNDIKSDNTSGAEGSADDLKNNSAFQDNTGLSGVISMPLTFVNSLTNTCQPINLNIPYMDVDVTIPCMQSVITDKMPLLANLIKIIVNGFIVYRILLDIFQIVRNAKNPEDDRIEVLDL